MKHLITNSNCTKRSRHCLLNRFLAVPLIIMAMLGSGSDAFAQTYTLDQLKQTVIEYSACVGGMVTINLKPLSGLNYYYYNSQVGGGSVGALVFKDATPEQIIWVEAREGGYTYPRFPVYVTLSDGCGETDLPICVRNGTLLYRGDFGGNSESDPIVKPSGIPEVVGFNNYIPVYGGRIANGEYSIMKALNNTVWHSNAQGSAYGTPDWYQNVDDHTSPNNASRGYMVLFNATEQPSEQFYETVLNGLCENTTLYFGAWIYNILAYTIMNGGYVISKPNLSFILEHPTTGEIYAVYNSGNIPNASPGWKQYGFKFTIPSGVSSVRVRMVNSNVGLAGNDFLLDDIEIYLCAPKVDLVRVQECGAPIAELRATCIDDGTLMVNPANPFKGYWIQSPSGNVNNPGEWTKVPNSDTSAVSGANFISSIHVPNTGGTMYYRFVTGNSASVNYMNCRAMSDVIEVKYMSGATPSFTTINALVTNNTVINLYSYIGNLQNATTANIEFSTADGNSFDANKITNPSSYTVSKTRRIYVRVTNSSNCTTLGSFEVGMSYISTEITNCFPSTVIDLATTNFYTHLGCAKGQVVLANITSAKGAIITNVPNTDSSTFTYKLPTNFVGVDTLTISGVTRCAEANYVIKMILNVVDAKPTITTAASATPSVLCMPGGTVMLSATASAGADIRWYAQATGGTPLTGNAPNVTITTTYYAEAYLSNGCASAARSPVQVTINPATEVTGQGSAGSYCLNTPATDVTALSVSATGTGALTYQWYSNATASKTSGTLLSGATSSAYKPSTNTAGTLYYYCVVTGNCGQDTSAVSGAIIINPATKISNLSTATATYCQNDAVTGVTALIVTAIGGTLTYQWYSNTTASNTNGILINGAASSTYKPLTTTAGVLYYYCVVTGDCGKDTSAVSGAIIVNPATKVNSQITATATYCQYDEAASVTDLNVTATGTGTLTYQWYVNTTAGKTGGVLLSGATSSTYKPLTTTAGILYYYCVVTGDCGKDTSAVSGAIIINPATKVNNQVTAAAAYCLNTPEAEVITLNITATGTGALTYQWYSNTTSGKIGGTLLSGATSNTYKPLTTTVGTLYYYCVVTGDCGKDTSVASGGIEINVLPVQGIITGDSVCVGKTLALTNDGNGATKTWRVVNGAGSVILSGNVLTGVSAGNVTVWCISSNASGCMDSVSKVIKVNPATLVTSQTLKDTVYCINTPVGGVSNISITATGTNISYQWYKNTAPDKTTGTLISGAINNTYTPLTTVADTFYYYCVVIGADICGNDTSDMVRIIINPLSTSLSNLIARDTTICKGSSVDLTKMIKASSDVVNPVFTWYASISGSTIVNPLIVTCNDTTTYYVSVKGDNYCEGLAGAVGRDSMTIWVLPFSMALDNIFTRDTAICEGSSVNLTKMVTPSTDIVNPTFTWYATLTGSTLLSPTTVAPAAGTHTYYVSVYGDNYCEGQANAIGRDSVIVFVKRYSSSANITITGLDSLCTGQTTILTTTSGDVINPTFKWYKQATGGAAFFTGATYATGKFQQDSTYYVSVYGDNYCEGASRDTIKVRVVCFTVKGTVFPFVYWGDPEGDTLFKVTARLYEEDTNVTPQRMFNDIVQNRIVPIRDTIAKYYDGSEFVLGAPKRPGKIMSPDNPGEPIDWEKIGKSVSFVDNTLLTEQDNKPESSIGLYAFENVRAGNYILVLSRDGFLIRMGRIMIHQDRYLGHRELIPGDADGNQQITVVDASMTTSMMSSMADPKYNPRYDYDGNLKVDILDVSIVKYYLNTNYRLYRETFQWINSQ